VSRWLKQLLVVIVVLSTVNGAASLGVALSHRRSQEQTRRQQNALPQTVPRPVYFRDVSGRGLLVRAWVNGIGPFNFALDTGAGHTVISPRVASEARVAAIGGRSISITGLSGAKGVATEGRIDALAIGQAENRLPGKGDVLIAGGLPVDLDGILDPTEALSPFGYVIDLPMHELSVFDPHNEPIQTNHIPQGGTVVSWLREAGSRRPFVMLDDGRRALLDTGSSLGLAVRETGASRQDNANYSVGDIGGGRISARRVAPTTVSIGSLELRRVPTDLVSGAEVDAPVLLGLSALRPFRLRFDPVHHLIEIAPERQ
jgi:predicted aspartyl protease